MKRIKKLTVWLLILVLAISVNLVLFGCAEESNENQTENYDTLLNYGYPEEFLRLVSSSALDRIVSSIGENDVSSVKHKTDYFTFNKDGEKDVMVQSVIAELTNRETGEIAGESVCVYWEWTGKKPVAREKDYISAQWNKKYFCYAADSFYAEDYCRASTDDPWTVSNTYTVLAEAGVERLAHWSDLEEFKAYTGGAMCFNLLPVSPIDKSEHYDGGITLNYIHSYKTTLAVTLIIALLVTAAVIVIIIKKAKNKQIKSSVNPQ